MAQRRKRSLEKVTKKPVEKVAPKKRRSRRRIRIDVKFREKVAEFLRDNPNASADMIRKGMNMGHETVMRALTTMERLGEVISTGKIRKHWRLTPEKASKQVATVVPKPIVVNKGKVESVQPANPKKVEKKDPLALVAQAESLIQQLAATINALGSAIVERQTLLNHLKDALSK